MEVLLAGGNRELAAPAARDWRDIEPVRHHPSVWLVGGVYFQASSRAVRGQFEYELVYGGEVSSRAETLTITAVLSRRTAVARSLWSCHGAPEEGHSRCRFPSTSATSMWS